EKDGENLERMEHERASRCKSRRLGYPSDVFAAAASAATFRRRAGLVHRTPARILAAMGLWAARTGPRRRFFRDVEPFHRERFDLDIAEPDLARREAADRKPPDRQRADRERAQRNGAHRHRA